MRPGTLFSYLLGRRGAILTIAADRHALGVACLLVLSAALAREYDTTDLTEEPLWLLLPWGMSLLASLLLWSVVYLPLLRSEERPRYFAGYRVFLTLFWMTAPLAWLYAVPYERFLSPFDATVANLWTLALVAAWRVVLTVRIVQVLLGTSPLSSAVLVVTAAMAVAMAAIYLSPKPILTIMGGIAHPPREKLLVEVTITLLFLGLYGLAILALPFLGFLVNVRPKPAVLPEPTNAGRPVWGLAMASVFVWGFFLPFTQAEQRRASAVDDLLAAGEIHQALDRMSADGPEAYPPHFTPRPRPWPGELEPPLLDVVDALGESPAAPWVERCYLEKARTRLITYRASIKSLDEVRSDPDVRALLERGEEALRRFEHAF